jgi:chorismate mutase / prephenate dehydratase
MTPNSPTNQSPADADSSLHSLAPLRDQIDAIDAQILFLINQRAQVAQEVGLVKSKTNAPVLRPEREIQVLERLVALNQGPISAIGVHAIWREIISTCRALEHRLKVAFLGPSGTFSELALLANFGTQVEAVPCVSIDEVFRSVQAQACDFGVVPVENSTEGSVNRTLDLFLHSPLQVCAEVSLAVRHCLMGTSSIENARTVSAHPQALAQCQGWLNQHAPKLERVAVSSNAEAARIAAQDASVVAIAGERAASQFNIPIIAANIQDDPLNRTRFAVIGNLRCGASGSDQTSLIVSVPDKAGAVHALIEPLARHGVSMKRFESRPARQEGWEYNFYIDIIGHQDDENVSKALSEIKAFARYYKVVGSYPRAR